MTSRWNATQDFSLEGSGTATSARSAGGRKCTPGQEITEKQEISYQDIASRAKRAALGAWKHFKAFKPFKDGRPPESVVDPPWVLTWKMVDGNEGVKARLDAKRNQGPDLMEGCIAASGCVSLRPSHLQVLPLEARRHGVFGVWTSRMLSYKQMVLDKKYFFAPLLNGSPMKITEFGNRSRRHMG